LLNQFYYTYFFPIIYSTACAADRTVFLVFLLFNLYLAFLKNNVIGTCNVTYIVGQSVKHDTKFFIEYFATDLLMHNGNYIIFFLNYVIHYN